MLYHAMPEDGEEYLGGLEELEKGKKKENPKKTKTEKFSVIFFVKIDRDFLKFEIIRDTQKIFSFHHSSKISLWLVESCEYAVDSQYLFEHTTLEIKSKGVCALLKVYVEK